MKSLVCIVTFILSVDGAAIPPGAATGTAARQGATATAPAKRDDTAALTAEQAKAEVAAIITEGSRIFSVDLKAEIVCPELLSIVQTELNKKSPIPLTVSRIFLVQTNGKCRIDFDLVGLPSGFPPEVLTMAAQAAKVSNTGRAIERVFSSSLVRTAGQILLSKEDFAVVDVTGDFIRAEVNQVNEPFFGNRMIRTIMCQVGRKTRTVDSSEFVFTDNKRMAVTIRYVSVKMPRSDTRIEMPSEMTFAQDIGFAGFPAKFTLAYKGYVFTGQNE
jgi:hypothetical protein